MRPEDSNLQRAILLPTSMRLLGDWNWYLSKWLEWLPRVGADRPTKGVSR
jgi:RND superfamily putative drug exporter